MRERLTTLVCALAALLLIGTLLLRGDPLAARRATPPTTLEHSDNGLLGARTWLQSEGVRTFALRERLGALLRQTAFPHSGNLLIVSLPAVTGFRSDEAAALDRWIRDGNTLLVLAALRDRPGWAQYPFVMNNDLPTGRRRGARQRLPSAVSAGVVQPRRQNDIPKQVPRASRGSAPSSAVRSSVHSCRTARIRTLLVSRARKPSRTTLRSVTAWRYRAMASRCRWPTKPAAPRTRSGYARTAQARSS